VEPITGLREGNPILPWSEIYILNGGHHFISVLDKNADSSGIAGKIRDNSLEPHPLTLHHRIRGHLQLKDSQITGMASSPGGAFKTLVRLRLNTRGKYEQETEQ
jgi:hypothetical protein